MRKDSIEKIEKRTYKWDDNLDEPKIKTNWIDIRVFLQEYEKVKKCDS